MNLTAGVQVGPWTLREKLGAGGNAEVWSAVRSPNQNVFAVKVLKTRKVGSEPYERFIREITFLRSLDDLSGVLPLVDAHLTAYSERAHAWLAMPIATSIDAALAGAHLERVVEAVATIARTLTRLKAEHRVAHRDIKPGNLYELNGEWLVGDFGLIDVPDLAELTRSGKPLGPAHYIPYEMIADPVHADSFAADVYSLGKTLWVLATGQRFPLSGHQPTGTRGFMIGDYRPHPGSEALDRLVDLMTLVHAEKRPTMEQVAADLGAWQGHSAGISLPDLSELGLRLRKKMAAEMQREDLEEHYKALGLQAVRTLQLLSTLLHDALKQVHPSPEIDSMGDDLTKNVLRTQAVSGSPDIVFRWQRCSRIASGPDFHPYSLRMGRSIEVTGDGQLIFRALLSVGHETTGGGPYWWLSDDKKAPAGSIASEGMLQEAVNELAGHLAEALNAFVDHLPGS
ncbi:MAG: protein kinase domain-containing protein [Thermoleophilia bacterium]